MRVTTSNRLLVLAATMFFFTFGMSTAWAGGDNCDDRCLGVVQVDCWDSTHDSFTDWEYHDSWYDPYYEGGTCFTQCWSESAQEAYATDIEMECIPEQ